MPETIRRLSEEIVGKIAAGEVVERPAAAIKELVENSLDAGASAVTVEIRDGGISYLRVTDNGSGIRQGDIRMAFERHATSKISSAGDLTSIATLGFRGEALASIAAVGHVTCTTRTAADPSGLKVQNDGGRITALEDAACPQGTTIVVRDLFFNVPVRLKFLKKPQTEAGYVSDVMMHMILSRPDVSFRLVSQGKTLYHSPGDGKLASAVYAIYGSEMLRSMREVKGSQSGVLLSGYVGIGESGRGNRSHQSFFINGRYMHAPVLSAAVEEACRERVMIGKYPACVLHLTMPYETVDVNVHPNKLEVRFQNEAAVAQAVTDIVRDALRDRDAFQRPVSMELGESKTAPASQPATLPVIPVRPAGPAPRPAEGMQAEEQPIPKAPVPRTLNVLRQTPAAGGLAMPAPLPPPMVHTPVRTPAPAPAPEQVSALPREEKKPLKILGVLFDTYILVEYADHLLMIDQHAVHERLLFDDMMQRYDTRTAGQELLLPVILPVTRREQQLLEENRELLEGIGFQTEPFGESEISVRTIPMILGQPQTAAFLREILDQLTGEGRAFPQERRRAAILQTACKHAVKGGEKLGEADIRSLVERMIDQQVTPTCPHGRPLVVAISHTELDRKFKRIQN